MPHLELSVSDPHVAGPQPDRPLDHWAVAVAAARQPCLLLDNAAGIVAISDSFHDLLGADSSVIGRDLLSGVLQLLDFAHGGALTEDEIGKIPPILALTSGRLARGLLRIASATGAVTLDAIATPLVGGTGTAGSLTFFSPV